MQRIDFRTRGRTRLASAAVAAAVWGGFGLISSGCHDAGMYAPPPPLGPPPVYAAPPPRPFAIKPLPDPRRADVPAPPYDDAPLVYQRVPEAQEFVRAYAAVGRPRLVVFVNRTLDGAVVEPSAPEGTGRVERFERQSSGGPGYFQERTERSSTTLRPGQYDAAGARAIDYQAIETKLADWLACDGQVTIVSPATVRQRLTDDQVQKLQQGRPRILSEVAKALDADVLVHVQASPTSQTERGLEIRLIAEVVNIGAVRTGESLARAVVPVPPPLETERVNQYTRFVARKLMSDMTAAWMGPGPDAGPGGPGAPPPPPTGGPTSSPPTAPGASGGSGPYVPPPLVLPPPGTSPGVPAVPTEPAPPAPPTGPSGYVPGQAPPTALIAPPPPAQADTGIPPERPSLLVRPESEPALLQPPTTEPVR